MKSPNIAKKLLQSQFKRYSALPGSSIKPATETTQLQRLLNPLRAYGNCRQWRLDEAGFKSQLSQLQLWQSARVRETHKIKLADAIYRNAAEFLLVDAYQGIDFSVMLSQIEKAIPYIVKFFPEKLLDTVELALHLNKVTAELDEALTTYIFEHLEASEMTQTVYLEAFLSVDGVDWRHRQLNLMADLIDSITTYVKNPWLYKAFKWAKKPAYAAGFAQLYDFLSKGLIQLRQLDEPVALAKGILAVEHQVNQRIADGALDPFDAHGIQYTDVGA